MLFKWVYWGRRSPPEQNYPQIEEICRDDYGLEKFGTEYAYIPTEAPNGRMSKTPSGKAGRITINLILINMKRTFTSQPIVPTGYTGRDYNNWQKYLQKQIDKFNRPSMMKRELSYGN